jgi:hypothetical protein
MSSFSPRSWLFGLCLSFASVAVFGFALAADAANGQRLVDPLRFFEGRTESVSIIRVIAKRPYRSRSVGLGEITADGVLHLTQRVEDEGRSPYERRWLIRQIAPGQFAGTMTEARGPVTVVEMEGRYRFRFKMKGNVSVEQWLTPLPGGKSARSKITIRKLGITVGSSEGMIHKS